MKHLLFSLVMLMAVQTAQAYCVTFIPQGQSSTNTSINSSIDAADLHLYHVIDDGTHFKITANGYIDVYSPFYYITKIVVECAAPDDEAHGPSNIWSYWGGYSYDGIYGIWDGGEKEVSLNVGDEVWITKILVYMDRQEGLSISPRSTTQYGTYKVNISSSHYDAKIYYTLDGSSPTVNSTEFINSFNLDSEATVKAIAVRNGAVIDSASVSYQYVPYATYAHNIQESLALPDETAVRFRNPIYVVRQMGPYLWVKDDSGYALIIGDCSRDYVTGNQISRGNSYPYYDFGATKTTVYGVPVLIKPGGFSAARRGPNVEIEPETVSLSQVNLDMFAHYVYLDSLTINTQDGGQSYVITDKSGATCPADFATMNINVPDDLEEIYNIWAIVGFDSNGSPELIILKAPVDIDQDETLVISPNQVGPSTCGHQVSIKQVLRYDVRDICNIEGESCESYIAYGFAMPAVLCWSYDVEGEVESYEYWTSGDYVTGYRFRMATANGHHGNDDIADVNCIKSLYRLRDIRYFDLTGHFTEPLTAVYQNGDYLYVHDSDGDYGLVIDSICDRLTNGDIIYDAKAKSYVDDGVDYISAVDPSSFTPGGQQAPVLPEILTIQDVSRDMVHRYLSFDGVKLTDGDNQGLQFMTDNTGTLPLCNLFDIDMTTDNDSGSEMSQYDLNRDGAVNINDASTLIDQLLTGNYTPLDSEGTCDVTGFVAIIDNSVQFYPVEIVRHRMDGDINNDGEVNIHDITALVDFILNDK